MQQTSASEAQLTGCRGEGASFSTGLPLLEDQHFQHLHQRRMDGLSADGRPLPTSLRAPHVCVRVLWRARPPAWVKSRADHSSLRRPHRRLRRH